MLPDVFTNYMLYSMGISSSMHTNNLVSVIQYGAPIIYIIGFWHLKGATPGEMLFKLKIVDAETLLPPALGSSIIRYLGCITLSIRFGLGFLWAIWGKRKQGWDDKRAGTVVIYKDRANEITNAATDRNSPTTKATAHPTEISHEATPATSEVRT